MVMKKNVMKKLFAIISLAMFFSCAGFSQPSTWFKISVKTDNTGISNSTSFAIPIAMGTYNYDVDWNNDGTFDDIGVATGITHDYGVAGTYTINIRGTFPRIYFNNGGDKLKLMSIEQWGSISWTSMEHAFDGCANMVYNASDAPDLSGVTVLADIFRRCDNFNTDLSSWDVSTIVDMQYAFADCPIFNGNITTWDVSSVTDFECMFLYATVFNQDISSWVTSSATDMQYMFCDAEKFNQPIGGWDVSNVTNMEYMFCDAYDFNQNISAWNTANVTTMYRMFQYASSFNQNIGNWNTGSVYTFYGMFDNASAFNQDISNWDFSSVLNNNSLRRMLDYCGMDINNYDKFIIALEAQKAGFPDDEMELGARGLNYCIAEPEWIALDTYGSGSGWTIHDDGKNCSTLPIELTHFGVEYFNNYVFINWTTASEENNDYFTIEKSKDMNTWEIVDIIPGAGNSNTTIEYNCCDYKPYIGDSYYRLKQTDYNGEFSYSEVRHVNNVVNNSISAYYSSIKSGIVLSNYSEIINPAIKLIDSNGRLIWQDYLDPNENTTIIPIDNNITHGIYLLFVEGDNMSCTKKIYL